MHALDAEYLLLVQQLNINQRSAESKRVMVRHPECEQAVLFIVPQVKVVPGPPAVRERLQANRAYISLYLPIPPYTSIYLPYISPTSPPHLPYISPISRTAASSSISVVHRCCPSTTTTSCYG